jgi:hypothetical protein
MRFSRRWLLRMPSSGMWHLQPPAHAGFSRAEFFYPENGGDTFFRNVGSHKIYTAPHPRRRYSSQTTDDLNLFNKTVSFSCLRDSHIMLRQSLRVACPTCQKCCQLSARSRLKWQWWWSPSYLDCRLACSRNFVALVIGIGNEGCG